MNKHKPNEKTKELINKGRIVLKLIENRNKLSQEIL